MSDIYQLCSHSRSTIVSLAIVCLSCFVILSDTRVSHAEDITGTVVDSESSPIPDCYMVSHLTTTDNVRTKVESRTDEKGRFSINLPANVRPASSFHTWIFKPGHALRVVHFRAESKVNNAWPVAKIVLNAPRQITVRVLDLQGRPVQGATVEPLMYYKPSLSFSSDVPQGLVSHVPVEIRDRARLETNNAGEVECKCYDDKLLVNLCISNQEFGSQVFYLRNRTSFDAQFVPTGRVRVQIASDDPSQFAGAEMLVATWTKTRANASPPVSSLARVTIDEEGKFDIPALGEGRLYVELRNWPRKDVALPVLPFNQTITAGLKTAVEISTVRSVAITGRVLRSDQTPVADLGISSRNSQSEWLDSTYTDREGNYKLFATPGDCTLEVSPLSPDDALKYKTPEPVPVSVAGESKKVFEVAAIVLEEHPKTRLQFSDGSQRPHARAYIRLGYQLRPDYMLFKELQLDDQGCVTLPFSMDRELDMDDCPIKFYLANEVDENNVDVNQAFKIVRRAPHRVWLERDAAVVRSVDLLQFGTGAK